MVDRPDHVWCADITYVPMRRGTACFALLNLLFRRSTPPIFQQRRQRRTKLRHLMCWATWRQIEDGGVIVDNSSSPGPLFLPWRSANEPE